MELRPIGFRGDDLRYKRRVAGISTREMAHKLNISVDYLRALEAGRTFAKRNPKLILDAAEVLGVPVQEIAEVVER